jgi:hypothetical protein
MTLLWKFSLPIFVKLVLLSKMKNSTCLMHVTLSMSFDTQCIRIGDFIAVNQLVHLLLLSSQPPPPPLLPPPHHMIFFLACCYMSTFVIVMLTFNVCYVLVV